MKTTYLEKQFSSVLYFTHVLKVSNLFCTAYLSVSFYYNGWTISFEPCWSLCVKFHKALYACSYCCRLIEVFFTVFLQKNSMYGFSKSSSVILFKMKSKDLQKLALSKCENGGRPPKIFEYLNGKVSWPTIKCWRKTFCENHTIVLRYSPSRKRPHERTVTSKV